MNVSSSPTPTPKITRTELLWIVGAVIFGSILRLGFPGRMAVEHFDEGVYASNFWFGEDQGYAYPFRYLYAPPLLPAVIEWTMIFASMMGIKPTGFIPIIPSLIAGIAMIPSIWWICRRWFGPVAGLVSAWLVSTSDFHASYSRAALTDVPVCLFILWAVYFIEHAFAKCAVNSLPSVERGKSKATSSSDSFALPWRDIVVAGMFTGLAWWTKYNGWLPLAIGAAGGTLWQLMTVRAERQVRRVLTAWMLMAVIASLIWSPVLWDLQKYGGYAAVASNHSKYVVGTKGWMESAWKQLANVGIYESPVEVFYAPFRTMTRTNPEFRAANFWYATMESIKYFQMGLWQFGFSSLQSILFEQLLPMVFPVSCLLLAAFVCCRSLFQSRGQRALLPICLVTAWFAGLTVATPFYYPYPRLVLPWLCSTLICIGLLVQTWRTDRGQESATGAKFFRLRILVAALVIVACLRLISGDAAAWQDRSELQTLSSRFARSIRSETSRLGFPENEALVYVFAEPAMVGGLKAEGLPLVGPVANLDFLKQPAPRPIFVVFTMGDSAVPAEVRDELMSMRFERVDGDTVKRSHLVQNEPGRGGFSRGETKLFRFFK